MIRNVITKLGLLRTALAVGFGIPFLIATNTYAQGVEAAPTATPATQAAAAPATTGSGAPNTGQTGPNQTQTNAVGGTEATTERVIVTGSNIPTAEEVGPNPVLSINRDLINKSGERNTEALLRDLPVANGGGIPLSNNGTGFTPGASSISLRGFTPEATLVLIDGRRLPQYPIGTGGTTSFFDLNAIPRAAIESIEILKDGASTTYGADAVAGVVNIKLRKDYRGAEATVQYGNTLDKDASQFIADVTFGIGDEKTQVTGVLDYYHQNSVFNRDRGFSAVPFFLSTNASPLNLQVSSDVAAAAGGQNLNPGGNEFATAPDFTHGTAPASSYIYNDRFRVRGGGGGLPGFNFNQFSGSFPFSERYGSYLSASHQVCGDQLVLYADGLYQKVKVRNELAPVATGNFVTANQPTIAIPPRTPIAPGDEPPNTPTHSETGVPADAFNPFNPFNQIISGGSRARLVEFGNRVITDDTDNILATIGMKGDKLFDGTWGYDAGFRYGEVKLTETNGPGFFSLKRFNRILNAADPIFDPKSDQYIGTTIPYNPFGDFRVPIPSNAATVAFASVVAPEIDTSKIGTVDLNIYTTQLFKLPAGGVGLAFGGQFRREQEFQSPDDLQLQGDLSSQSPKAITRGGRKDYAFYAEASIPIFSPEKAIPGFHSLEFTASGRFEEFLNNDSNVLVPKVGMRWQPLDEQLTIRATWGEGFREPSLFELFSSPTQGLLPTNFKGNFDPETPVVTSSNPNLQPEDSRTFSGGVVFTPKFVSGLTLSVDIYDIERKGVVVAPTAQEVVNRFLNNQLLPGEAVILDPSGASINAISDSFQNAGRQNTRGVDLGLQYQLQTPYGTFTSLTNATYVDSFIFQATEQSRAREISGRVIDNLGGDAILKWKAKSRLDWAWNGFDIVTTVNYLDGFKEKLFGAKEHYVDGTLVFDVQGSYNFTFAPPVENQPVAGYSKDAKEMVRGKDGKRVEPTQTANYSMPCWKNLINNTTITVGCNNVFGQDPPVMFGAFKSNANGYPGFIYTDVGRFVYLELTKKF